MFVIKVFFNTFTRRMRISNGVVCIYLGNKFATKNSLNGHVQSFILLLLFFKVFDMFLIELKSPLFQIDAFYNI